MYVIPRPEAVPLPGPSFSIYSCHVGKVQVLLEAAAVEKIERGALNAS